MTTMIRQHRTMRADARMHVAPRRIRRLTGMALLAAVLFISSLARAAGGGAHAGLRCEAAKLHASAALARRLTSCFAHGVSAKAGLKQSCVAAARNKLETAFAAAEARFASCATTGDASAVATAAETFFTALADSATRTGAAKPSCPGAVVRLSGNRVRRLLRNEYLERTTSRRSAARAAARILAANIALRETGARQAVCLVAAEIMRVRLDADDFVGQIVRRLDDCTPVSAARFTAAAHGEWARTIASAAAAGYSDIGEAILCPRPEAERFTRASATLHDPGTGASIQMEVPYPDAPLLIATAGGEVTVTAGSAGIGLAFPADGSTRPVLPRGPAVARGTPASVGRAAALPSCGARWQRRVVCLSQQPDVQEAIAIGCGLPLGANIYSALRNLATKSPWGIAYTCVPTILWKVAHSDCSLAAGQPCTVDNPNECQAATGYCPYVGSCVAAPNPKLPPGSPCGSVVPACSCDSAGRAMATNGVCRQDKGALRTVTDCHPKMARCASAICAVDADAGARCTVPDPDNPPTSVACEVQCGNSVTQAAFGEECDGADDSACPGRCRGPQDAQPCTCAPPAPDVVFWSGASASTNWAVESLTCDGSLLGEIVSRSGMVQPVTTGCLGAEFDDHLVVGSSAGRNPALVAVHAIAAKNSLILHVNASQTAPGRFWSYGQTNTTLRVAVFVRNPGTAGRRTVSVLREAGGTVGVPKFASGLTWAVASVFGLGKSVSTGFVHDTVLLDVSDSSSEFWTTRSRRLRLNDFPDASYVEIAPSHFASSININTTVMSALASGPITAVADVALRWQVTP